MVPIHVTVFYVPTRERGLIDSISFDHFIISFVSSFFITKTSFISLSVSLSVDAMFESGIVWSCTFNVLRFNLHQHSRIRTLRTLFVIFSVLCTIKE